MIRRVLAAVVLLATAIALLIAVWPQLFGLQHAPFVAHVVSLRALASVCAALGAVVLLLIAFAARSARRFAASLAVVVGGFALLGGVVLADRGFAGELEREPAPESITVLAWNTLGDEVSVEDIATLAVDTRADVVALPETTRDTAVAIAVRMRDFGRPMWALTEAHDEVLKARSTSLLVSAELGEYRIRAGASPTRQLPTLVAEPVNGSGPMLVAVHAVAPIADYLDAWRADLVAISHLCRDDDVILAGDFNATVDHFSGIGGDGPDLGRCTDAALEAGAAAVGTWPTALPAMLGAPIDHVLSTDAWVTTAFRVVDTLDHAGSDHRPVVATLQPARRQ